MILTAAIAYGDASVSRDFEVAVGKIVSPEDIVTQAVYKIREYYNDNRNLTQNYWAVWMAKSVLRDDFDKYNFSVYNVKTHKAGRNWAGTDWGGVVLQIVAQGDNPYDYQGYNYVQGMINYINQYGDKPNWGGFAEPVFLTMGLDAAGAMTPELQQSALETVSGMMGSIKSGPDYGGWAMVPISNYIYNTGDQTYVESFDTFRELCLEALERESGHAQYGYIGGEPYAGYSAAAGSNCVLIGSVGAMRAGILGFDLQKGDWVQADGKTNIVSQIYDSVFKNKYAPYSQQQSIAFADLYHGSNVWVSENPSPAKLSALLDTAEDVLKNAATHYSEKTLLALQTAYDKAKSYKDAEYNFGKAYFDLRDAIKGLQEANSIFVSILGNAERQKVLTEYVVHTPGLSYLEILQTACAENGMTIATSDQEITEVDGLQKVSGSAWYVYDGEVRKTNLQQIPGEGTVITLKYCLDTQAVGEAATLDEHLLLEAEAALNLGDISAATQDLTLPDMGLFGVAISWISDKPANITHDGRITRSNNDVSVGLTAKLSAPNGASSTKQFIAVVKGTQGSNPTEKAYAYISVKDPKGRTFYTKAAIEIESGETAYTLLVKTGLDLEVSPHTQYGVYVAAIEGRGEFSDGPDSGWMYKITHKGSTSYPGFSAAYQAVADGDYVEWLFTRDLGADIGNIYSGGSLETSKPNSGSSIIINPKVAVKESKAIATIDVSDISAAIVDAKKNDSKAIVITPEITGKAQKVSVQLPKTSISSMVSETDATLKVETPVGTIVIPQDVLTAIASQASGSTVTMSLESVDKSSLTPTQQEAVGDKPVYDISIMSGSNHISSFDGKSITISLPYTLQEDESANNVKVWYLNDAGELEQIDCSYDEKTGLATFKTDHLSYYLVGVEVPEEVKEDDFINPFTDVKEGDWFYEFVKFAVENDLFKGTGETTFSPNEPMTRAMLVTVLHSLEGSPEITGANNFTDMKNGEWYTKAVIWANANDIVSGYGNELFGTNDPITREQMAALLYNYASYKGYDVTAIANLSAYTDAAAISSWAEKAMSWANAEGLITGRTATTLAPAGNATRAEVASILKRFVEGIVE